MTKRILAFERADLLKEWDFEKNAFICSPEEITIGSNKKVWWKCNKYGYEWQATITNRAKGKGCPNCAAQRRKK